MNQPSDISDQLQDKVRQAIETGDRLIIKAGGTKDFYGRSISGKELSVAEHQGIINYEPTELVITARAGTKLKIIEQILTENNQMLAFEPPTFGNNATLGGTIACNFSGPRRAYSGAARDSVLGSKIINGKAEVLSFGGEVMKNVAGYDVSRLMAGAMGTLGVLLEVSLKVIPKPEAEITFMQNINIEDALEKLHQWVALPLPISASCFYQNVLYIRLSGSEKSIRTAQQSMGGEILIEAESFWHSVKEQTHDFFKNDQSLWRLSLASNTPNLPLDGDSMFEWGGALRWLKTDMSQDQIHKARNSINGHISLFRTSGKRDDIFQPLPKHLLQLHSKLKQAFDPHGIFNIGRMYQEF
ncbi:MAG: glycolate oxidase subunit GlcE [Methylococcaceae bacterium]